MSITDTYHHQYPNFINHDYILRTEDMQAEYGIPLVGADFKLGEIINFGRNKAKTSLCKKYAETGSCPYGYKCQFAHGLDELRCNVDENSYKTKPCNSYFKKGLCMYGDRCNFSHRSSVHEIPSIDYRSLFQETKHTSLILEIQIGDEQTDVKSTGSTEESKSESFANQRTCEKNNKINGNIAHCEFHLENFFMQNIFNPIAEGKADESEAGLILFNIDQFC